MQIPDTAPFSADQKAALNQLLPSLSVSQLQWLAGFGAGVDAANLGQGIPASAPVALQVPAASAKVEKLPITIAYGSESGNAEGLAHDTAKAAKKAGFVPRVEDMGETSLTELSKAANLLVITSTWGDGDPPENAVSLHGELMGDSAPSFDGVNFAVLSLGDTSYDKFCQTGKDFDKRLEELGGKRLADRVDSDVDFEEPYDRWLGSVMDVLKSNATTAAPAASTTLTVDPAVAPAIVEEAPVKWGRKNPAPGVMSEKILLNGRGSIKETWHYEISLGETGMHYEPGDSLAVVPRNATDTVEELLNAGNFINGVVPVEGGSQQSLGSALASGYDITGLSRKVLEKYNEFAKSAKLKKLLAPEAKEDLKDYLWGRQIVDMLEEFPVKEMDASDFLGLLRKLPPRLYSIASSLKAHPDEVHLTVASVRYQSHGKDRKGVASTWLADDVETGDILPVWATPNKNFKLPTDGDTPIIMVGPGTGVAPFRAFVEDRAETGASGDNWLFFGDQHYTTDFLYQLEWQSYLKDGVLSRLDVAFSRDQKQKVYVQHRMLERAADLWAWLDKGAHFYVCGDATRMAGDVHEALLAIAEQQGGMSKEDAIAWLDSLKKAKRYQRDVY